MSCRAILFVSSRSAKSIPLFEVIEKSGCNAIAIKIMGNWISGIHSYVVGNTYGFVSKLVYVCERDWENGSVLIYHRINFVPITLIRLKGTTPDIRCDGIIRKNSRWFTMQEATQVDLHGKRYWMERQGAAYGMCWILLIISKKSPKPEIYILRKQAKGNKCNKSSIQSLNSRLATVKEEQIHCCCL